MTKTTVEIPEHVLEVLDTFPEKERGEAIAAIQSASDWEQETDGMQAPFPMFYQRDKDGYWESYELYVLFRVEDGVLKQSAYTVQPCGDAEWTECENDIIVVDENFQKNVDALQARLFKQMNEGHEEYEKWVEDNGKDPLSYFWFNDLFGKEKPDPNCRFQVSLQAWYINQGIYPQGREAELVEQIKQRFPEGGKKGDFRAGFWSSLRVGRTVIEYPMKYHCDRPMEFQAELPKDFSLCDDSIYEPFAGWVCKECGESISGENDDIDWRETNSPDDDE